MKVVCISIPELVQGHTAASQFELGKVYEGNLIFDGKSKWENNYLTLEGFGMDWFPSKCFISLEDFRDKKLNELGIE